VSDEERLEIRMRLAAGHWTLQEYDEAVRCIQWAIEEDPGHPGLPRLLAQLRATLDEERAPSELRSTLDRLTEMVEATESGWDDDDLPPLTTATVAELLAEQGLPQKAVRVAEHVLERNPSDERARTLLSQLSVPGVGDPRIAPLERWLENIRRWRTQGGRHV
jgi:tetratricopeptide (TPR) repeat protein